jgi:hypothetical protein
MSSLAYHRYRLKAYEIVLSDSVKGRDALLRTLSPWLTASICQFAERILLPLICIKGG